MDFHPGKDYHLLPRHGPDDLTEDDSDLNQEADHGPTTTDMEEEIEEAIETTERPKDPQNGQRKPLP